ncbi:MAG: hypothetical protein Q8881_04175, partial [Sweet potato little leaf phytoplasma]|nr:hypothetical protein [Sweet potato little leaf phytoplasma]
EQTIAKLNKDTTTAIPRSGILDHVERNGIVDFMLKRSSPRKKSRQKLVFFLVQKGACRTFVGTESNGISHSNTLDHMESNGFVDFKLKSPALGKKLQKKLVLFLVVRRARRTLHHAEGACRFVGRKLFYRGAKCRTF